MADDGGPGCVTLRNTTYFRDQFRQDLTDIRETATIDTAKTE
jgi:hypothetical protein